MPTKWRVENQPPSCARVCLSTAILDVVQLSTIIINSQGESSSCQIQSGDFNSDGLLSILDIVPLVLEVVA